MDISVNFDTWKRLTALLQSETDDYSAVIGRLLPDHLHTVSKETDDERGIEWSTGDSHAGAVFKGLFLPEGTRMRASHRGKTYFATITGARWVDDETGESRTSPSHAAAQITGNSVNGWLFWLAKRPTDTQWHNLAAMRAAEANR